MAASRSRNPKRFRQVDGRIVDSKTGDVVPVIAGSGVLQEIADFQEASEQAKSWDEKKKAVQVKLLQRFSGLTGVVSSNVLKRRNRKTAEILDTEKFHPLILSTEWTREELLEMVLAATGFNDSDDLPKLFRKFLEGCTETKYSAYWLEITSLASEMEIDDLPLE